MDGLHYLLMISTGVLAVWLTGQIDDWLIAREKRKSANTRP